MSTFYFSWKSQTTNYKYQLFMTTPGTTAINYTYYPEYDADLPVDLELMEEGMIEKLELKWEYPNNYPFGMPSAIGLNIVFNLDYTQNEDFKYALFNPFYDFGENITLENWFLSVSSTFNYKYRAGNLIRLFCDFGNGNEYREIYIGMQKSGLGGKYNPIERKYTLESYDLNRCVMESFNMQFLREIAKTDIHVANKIYYDWLYLDNTNKIKATVNIAAGSITDKRNSYFWLYSLEAHIAFISLGCQAIFRKLMRNIDAKFSIEFNHPTYYKQTYSNLSNAKGVALLNSDLYVIGFVTDTERYTTNTKYYSGLFYNTIEKEYKTLWDYISDFAYDTLTKWFFSKENNEYKLKSLPITTNDTTYLDFKDSINTIYNLEIDFDHEILQRVESANQETIGQDISKFEVITGSSRSEKSLPLMVVHNTVPTAYDSDKNYKAAYDGIILDTTHVLYDNPTKFDLVNYPNPILRYSWTNRIKTLLYLDFPSFMTDLVPIRVHGYMSYSIGGTDSGAQAPYSQLSFSDMSDGQQPPGTVEANVVQNQQSKNLIQAKTMLNYLSNPNQIGISGNVLFTSCVDNFSSVFLYPYKSIYFDYTQLADFAYLTNYSNLFYVTKSEIDFIKENVKLEAMTIHAW